MPLPHCASIMMVAGEASGDMHAAKVIEVLLRKNKNVKIFGLRGGRMAKAGREVRDALARQCAMRVVEVVKHHPASLRGLMDCERWLGQEEPALLFLVDFPGFILAL